MFTPQDLNKARNSPERGSKMLIEHINKGLTAEEEQRPVGNPLRMSNAGKCARAITYQKIDFEQQEQAKENGKSYKKIGLSTKSRGKKVFRHGELTEEELKENIKRFPPPNANVIMPDKQLELKINIDGNTISGHPDGLILSENSRLVLECKSINTRGFHEVKKTGQPRDDHKRQAECYMRALGFNQVMFYYYNKDTSHDIEILWESDNDIWQEVIDRFRKAIKADGDNLPDREYKPSEKTGKLPWQCSYCSYAHICWPDFEVTWDNNGTPQLIKKKEKKEGTK